MGATASIENNGEQIASTLCDDDQRLRGVPSDKLWIANAVEDFVSTVVRDIATRSMPDDNSVDAHHTSALVSPLGGKATSGPQSAPPDEPPPAAESREAELEAIAAEHLDVYTELTTFSKITFVKGQRRSKQNPRYDFTLASQSPAFASQPVESHLPLQEGCPFTSRYPLFLVPGSVVLRLSYIPTHEELIAHKLIIESPSVEKFSNEDAVPGTIMETTSWHTNALVLSNGTYLSHAHKVIFFSHRWVQHDDGSLPTPDDRQNSKLKKIQAIVKPDDLVWVDYMCLPQDPNNREGQQNAILSLPYYIGQSSIVHILTTGAANRQQYMDRAFTNLELCCASMEVFVSKYYSFQDQDGNCKLKLLCEVYDEDGSFAFPFLNPVYADMYDKRDLPRIRELIDIIREHSRGVVEECETYYTYGSRPHGSRKLVEFLNPRNEEP